MPYNDEQGGTYNGGYGSASSSNPKTSTGTTTTASGSASPNTGGGGASNATSAASAASAAADAKSAADARSAAAAKAAADAAAANTTVAHKTTPGLGAALDAGINPTPAPSTPAPPGTFGPRRENAFRAPGVTPGTGYMRTMDTLSGVSPGMPGPANTNPLGNVTPTRPGYSFDTTMTPTYTLDRGLPNTPKNAPNPVGNYSEVPQNNLGQGVSPPTASDPNRTTTVAKTTAPKPNTITGMSYTPSLPGVMPPSAPPPSAPKYSVPIADIPADGIGYSLRTKVAPSIIDNARKRQAAAITAAQAPKAPQAPRAPGIGMSFTPGLPAAPQAPQAPTAGRSTTPPTSPNPGTLADQNVPKNNLGTAATNPPNEYNAPIDGKVISVENYNIPASPPNVFDKEADRSKFGARPSAPKSTYAGASFDPTRQQQAIDTGLVGSLAMGQGISPTGATISKGTQTASAPPNRAPSSIGPAMGQPYSSFSSPGTMAAAPDSGYTSPSQEGELTGNAAADNPNTAPSQQGIPKTKTGAYLKDGVDAVVSKVPGVGVINSIAGLFGKSVGKLAQDDYDRYANMNPEERAAWSERRASEQYAADLRSGDKGMAGTLADKSKTKDPKASKDEKGEVSTPPIYSPGLPPWMNPNSKGDDDNNKDNNSTTSGLGRLIASMKARRPVYKPPSIGGSFT